MFIFIKLVWDLIPYNGWCAIKPNQTKPKWLNSALNGWYTINQPTNQPTTCLNSLSTPRWQFKMLKVFLLHLEWTPILKYTFWINHSFERRRDGHCKLWLKMQGQRRRKQKELFFNAKCYELAKLIKPRCFLSNISIIECALDVAGIGGRDKISKTS